MGRAEQKAEAHHRIIAAAARQLREEGPVGMSVQRVMEEAGLTHGGFYSHFDSKEQLVAEALRVALENGRDRFAGVGAGAAPGPEQRQRMLRGYLSRAHRDDPGAGCPLPSTSAEVARAPETVRRAYDDELRKIIALFEAEFAGSPADEAHARAIGTMSLCVGSLLLARATLDSTLSDDILNSCRQFIAAVEKDTNHEQ
jgi:TetR/AcrR family transcriptional repressor of nem operon